MAPVVRKVIITSSDSSGQVAELALAGCVCSSGRLGLVLVLLVGWLDLSLALQAPALDACVEEAGAAGGYRIQDTRPSSSLSVLSINSSCSSSCLIPNKLRLLLIHTCPRTED